MVKCNPPSQTSRLTPDSTGKQCGMMKLLLGIVLFCSAYVTSLNGHIVNCDDPEAYQAANEAVNYINALHTTGYKFTLQQIDEIRSLPSDGPGEFFKLELDLLETTCPFVSPTPVENCPVRPRIEQAVEADCDVIVQKLNGSFSVYRLKCKSKLDSVKKTRRICPGCPMLAPLNDSNVVHAVDVALHKFNSANNTVIYGVHEIGRGQIQYGASKTIRVEFIAVAMNCTKEDAEAGVNACVEETGPNAHFATCSGTVAKVTGAADEVAVSCTVLEPQPAKEAQAPKPDPVAPGFSGHSPSIFHHNLRINNMGHQSSESNSGENFLLAAHANAHAVKRSLTGEPVHAHVSMFPLCPGKKLHP